MRASLRLGNIAGIAVGMHWSVLLIAVLLVSTLSGTILPASVPDLAGISYVVAGIATAGLFLASIVAHEFGHAIVARRNGIETRGITLFALGGVAALDRQPDAAGPAARIALAGPAVSVAVGVGSITAASVAGAVGLAPLTVAALSWLGLINLGLAVFNMIPALPLDGGRVLQAALWYRKGDRAKATIGAATVGRYLGWAIVALGLVQFSQGGSGLWTAMIGFFIVTSARAEAFRARMEGRRDAWTQAWTNATGPRPQGPFDPPRQGPFAPPHRGDVIDVDVIEADVIDLDSRESADRRRDGGTTPPSPPPGGRSRARP